MENECLLKYFGRAIDKLMSVFIVLNKQWTFFLFIYIYVLGTHFKYCTMQINKFIYKRTCFRFGNNLIYRVYRDYVYTS